MKKLFTLFIGLASTTCFAQTPLLSENFDFTPGDQLRNHGWYPHSAAATNPLISTANGLSLASTPYFGSGIGGAALVTNTGSDENKPLSSSVDTGSVYASFLLKAGGAVTTTGSGYFFHFVEYTNVSTPVFTDIKTAHRARTYITTGSTAANFRLGLTFNSNTVPSTVGTDVTADLDTSKTYLVVVKYTFVDGPDNDSVSLFVFEDGDSVQFEPAIPTLGPLAGTAADATAVQAIALRQYNASQNVIVDGIYVRSEWRLLTQGTNVANNALDNQLKVFPNPFSGGTLFIRNDNPQPMDATLLDVSGRIILQTQVRDNAIEIPNQAPGMYFLQVRQNGNVAVRKLIIR